MLLALLGAATSAAGFGLAFGVPVVAGAPVLGALASFGGLAGALGAALIARLRRKAAPVRTLGVCALLAVAGAAWLLRAPAAPAVIVMVVDCLRADRLTATKMPNVFARSADGVRFTRARSQSSWTRSAMPSLLSGRYPAVHGLYRTAPPDRIHDDVTMVAERFRDAGWLTAAFAQQPQLDAAFGYARGFGRYGWRDGVAPGLNARVLAWNTLFRSVPRFVLVHYIDVHAPYAPSRAFRPKDLPASSLAVRPYAKWRETVRAVERGRVVPTPDDWAFLSGLYDGEVAQVDAHIGELLDRWEGDGTLDAAWFVLTADHGERFGEHGGIAHMGPPDESVIAVPLLVRPPGGTPRRTVNDVVQHVDLVPTLLAATGLPADATLPGRDLGPALRGEPLAAAPSFAEEWSGEVHHASVRVGDWKLLRGRVTRLYDLSRDPRELRDVAADHPDVVARLDGMLAAYFAAGGAVAGVDWEAAGRSTAGWTPSATRTSTAAAPSEGTMEALEALGYLEGEE